MDEGAREPVVLLHGYANTLAVWFGSGVLPSLAKNHHVIAVDLRGHGKSGKPTSAQAYGEEMSNDVVRLLDHFIAANR